MLLVFFVKLQGRIVQHVWKSLSAKARSTEIKQLNQSPERDVAPAMICVKVVCVQWQNTEAQAICREQ